MRELKKDKAINNGKERNIDKLTEERKKERRECMEDRGKERKSLREREG